MTTLDKLVRKIPFDKIVGQTLMGYVDEIKSLEELGKMVLENALGGLIIGRRALSGLKNPDALLKELAASYRKTLGFSLILAAEHEGKGFEGLSPPVTELPSQMGVSATGEVKSAYIAGYVTALELRTLSINTNLAPVANLYSPEAGENCFGDDPEEVSSYVVSYIRGLRNGGLLSFVKYFPRRFFEARDEPEDLNMLFKRDFKPFQLAFKSGVEGVIIGHSPLLAAEGSSTPSSLSPKVVERIVKREMGFKNIIMTDYLDDEQVSGKFGPEEAAIRALKAGNHIVMPSRRIEELQQVLKTILEKAREDKELYNRVRSSALEVLNFKLRRLEKFKKTPEKTRGSFVNRVRAWKIFTQSITVVKGVDELPLRWLGKPLVVVSRRLRERLEADGKRLEELLREELGGFALEYVEEMPSKKMSELYRSTPSNTLLIMLSYNTHGNWREAPVLKKLAGFFRESIVISLGSPEDLTLLSDAKICVAAFTPSVTAIKAALKALKGKSKPSGKLPIGIKL